jgi:SAM-dependent methyltransferase
MSRTEQLARGVLRRLPMSVQGRVRELLAGLGTPELTNRELEPVPDRIGVVTECLFARLSPEIVAALPSRLNREEAAQWAAASTEQRKRLALAFGTHLGLPEVLDPTGLSNAAPPEGVHAMARGASHAGGAYDLADMVIEGLEQAGAPPEAGQAGLDFGCSSGRVVRVLAAAFPDLGWHGREPNARAIAWARDHLPGIDFQVSPETPPLDFAAAELDFVFAISIWSHFAEAAALRWFQEMRRVIRSGGHLLLTTHGYHSVWFLSAHQLRAPEWLAEAHEGLDRRGYWFYDEFRGRGDEGIENPEWGTCFFSLEWLCAKLTPEWQLVHYAIGRAQGNQDLIVLRRS